MTSLLARLSAFVVAIWGLIAAPHAALGLRHPDQEGAAASRAVAVSPVIIGYVFPQSTVIDPAQIAAGKLTHINYAFANIRDGRVVEGFARDAENFQVLAGLRRTHPHLRILVSVGGWTWSGGFSDAALTPESRRTFVQSAIDFVRRHDLDGFDVDWEYPGLRGNNNPHRPEDKENFTALMAELRAALDADGAARRRPLLLTFAAGAFPAFLEHIEMAKVQASVDFVNLMTYDFRTGGDKVAGHHANLFDHPADEKQRSGDRAVRDFIAAGAPPRKVVLGVPFYGRGWTNIEPTADGDPNTRRGLYRPGTALTGQNLRYGRLSSEVVGQNGYVRIWDPQAQQPWLWNPETRTFIAYDDPESLRVKTRYVRERGLGGVMFWEYGNDPTGALLEALYSGLRTL
jgi:chitinase